MAVRDLPTYKILEMVDQVLQGNPKAQCFLKWTCPKCKQRVTATQPNTFCASGYVHEENGCGEKYDGNEFGLMVIYPMDQAAENMVQDVLHKMEKEALN